MLEAGPESVDIILQEQYGVLCRIDDVEDIARGIEQILKRTFEYDPESDVSEFSCRASTEKLAKLFDRISSKQSRK